MKRAEALIHFQEEHVNELLEKYEKIFREKLEKNKNLLKDTIMDSLQRLCEKVSKFQNQQSDYKISCFQFSILRTSIINKSYKMLLIAYNEAWYLDDHPQWVEVDLSFLFHPLTELQKELYEQSKRYMGKVHQYDINKIILDQSMVYNESILHAARFIVQNIEEEEWFHRILKSDIYNINWGEYQDKTMSIYTMDTNEKNIKDFIEILERTDEDTCKDAFVCSVWKDSEINDITCLEKNMMFINFKGSTITNCHFTQSILLGGNFKNSSLNHCSFDKGLLQTANFENSTLENITFYQSNLMGANFVHAKFQEVSFQEAILDGAVFSREDVPFLHLSPSQLQVIYIEEERK